MAFMKQTLRVYTLQLSQNRSNIVSLCEKKFTKKMSSSPLEHWIDEPSSQEEPSEELVQRVRLKYIARGIFPLIHFLDNEERKKQYVKKRESTNNVNSPARPKKKTKTEGKNATKCDDVIVGPKTRSFKKPDDKKTMSNSTPITSKLNDKAPSKNQKSNKEMDREDPSSQSIKESPFVSIKKASPISFDDELEFNSQQETPLEDFKKRGKAGTPKKSLSGLEKVKSNEITSQKVSIFEKCIG